MVTLFPTLKKVESPFYKEIDDVLLSFKNQTNFKQISAIRKENDENKKASLKKLLMPICFSGEFSYRSAKNIIRHSGFACLDFDDVGTFEDAVCLRDSLQDNEYIYSAFISPSGNGVKAIVKIPKDIVNHKKYYEALCETFDSFLDLKTKDISRVCFASYDHDLFLNNN